VKDPASARNVVDRFVQRRWTAKKLTFVARRTGAR